MSAETPQPQPGDKVSVSFETTVASGAPDPYLVWVVTPGHASAVDRIVCVPTYAVEVLERADDPVKDIVGARRDMSTPEDDAAGVEHAEIGNWALRWTSNHFSGRPWVWFRWDGPQLLSNETVAGRPLIDPLPGTPAAEVADRPKGRVVLDPQGLGERLWRDLNRYAGQGDLNAAAGVLSLHTTMSSDEAIAYVRDMSEYQTYLAAHGEKREMCTRDECPAGPVCSSGATVWHDKTPECREVV